MTNARKSAKSPMWSCSIKSPKALQVCDSVVRKQRELVCESWMDAFSPARSSRLILRTAMRSSRRVARRKVWRLVQTTTRTRRAKDWMNSESGLRKERSEVANIQKDSHCGVSLMRLDRQLFEQLGSLVMCASKLWTFNGTNQSQPISLVARRQPASVSTSIVQQSQLVPPSLPNIVRVYPNSRLTDDQKRHSRLDSNLKVISILIRVKKPNIAWCPFRFTIVIETSPSQRQA